MPSPGTHTSSAPPHMSLFLHDVIPLRQDRVPKEKKTNVVYRAVCGVCGDDYVSELQQPLANRVHQLTHPAAGRPNSWVTPDTGWIWRASRSLKGNRTSEGEALERRSG